MPSSIGWIKMKESLCVLLLFMVFCTSANLSPFRNNMMNSGQGRMPNRKCGGNMPNGGFGQRASYTEDFMSGGSDHQGQRMGSRDQQFRLGGHEHQDQVEDSYEQDYEDQGSEEQDTMYDSAGGQDNLSGLLQTLGQGLLGKPGGGLQGSLQGKLSGLLQKFGSGGRGGVGQEQLSGLLQKLGTLAKGFQLGGDQGGLQDKLGGLLQQFGSLGQSMKSGGPKGNRGGLQGQFQDKFSNLVEQPGSLGKGRFGGAAGFGRKASQQGKGSGFRGSQGRGGMSGSF
ncbi:keratin, type I cytoskeletal 9-like [Pelobates fuscus]|uniref:keratin, type I cytoskeletal 9-like n=1 Tax=Pelobates fuscus TaxID=191477 RepID=UPI002FE4F945